MELSKDYECSILYHPSKVSVVGYALSRRSTGSLAPISIERTSLVNELRELIDRGLWLKVTKKCILAQFRV